MTVCFTKKVSLVKTYGVAVYELDRYYGGPEEGGWWYNGGTLVHEEIGYPDEDSASARVKELESGEFRTTGDLYSVVYRGGAYDVRLIRPGVAVPDRFSEYQPYS